MDGNQNQKNMENWHLNGLGINQNGKDLANNQITVDLQLYLGLYSYNYI